MNAKEQKRPGRRGLYHAGLAASIWRHLYFKWALFIVTMIIIVSLFPRGISFQYAEYAIGSVSDKEIIAPFDYPILKSDEELTAERKQEIENIFPYFQEAENIPDSSIALLRSFFALLETARDLNIRNNEYRIRAEPIPADSIAGREISPVSIELDSLTKLIYSRFGVNISENRWNFLRDGDRSTLQIFQNHLIRVLRDLYALGVLDRQKTEIESGRNQITIMGRNGEMVQSLNNLYDLEESRAEASGKIQNFYSSQSDTAAVCYELLVLALKPNIRFDERMTRSLRAEAVNRVPLTRGFVLRNQRIIDNHEIVTPEAYRKIQSLRMAISERSQTQSALHAVLPYIGKGLFISILLFLLFFALYYTRKKLYLDNQKVALILVILILEVFLAYGIVQHAGLSEYLIPTTMAAMLLVILFDSGVAFIGTVVVGFLIGGFLGNEFSITVISIFTGVVAARSVRKLRQRSQYFRAIPIIAASYLIALFALGLLRYMSLDSLFSVYWKYCIPNSIVSPILTLGLLYVFEMGFGVSTSIRLLELSDMNHPLLKALAVEAPGTYHHSIIMGNIAEAAAESIGANSLLTRVGAYYHDIGKIRKSEYFTENQVSIKNPHEKLAPPMSRLIIASHVKEGIELARKYRLPQEIVNMIAQHHGTSKISFFYEKALERSDARLIQEEDYRYPGPRPQTKEAGILMLADTMEAASRSLKNPSITRIREIVANTIEKKFKEGELGDCELTLRDLDRMKDSFINSLIGMHHTRLEYPNKENGQTAGGEEKSAEKSAQAKN